MMENRKKQINKDLINMCAVAKSTFIYRQYYYIMFSIQMKSMNENRKNKKKIDKRNTNSKYNTLPIS